MTNDRRNQRRRRERRRSRRPAYEPVGPVEFTGIMGYFQRRVRAFFLGGIVVMVLSLGGFVFASQLDSGTTATADDLDPTATATPEPTATASATPDAEPTVVRAYSAAPEFTIDPDASYEAVIHLEAGDVRITLLPDVAPEYVNNFVFLARNDFYDGLVFHRVVPGFVAQAGDPSASGFGDAGYSLAEEKNGLVFEPGVLSMAKAGARVSSSQFFVTLDAAPHLNGDFTVFGRVTSGLELLQALPAHDPGDPDAATAIVDIEIIEGTGG